MLRSQCCRWCLSWSVAAQHSQYTMFSVAVTTFLNALILQWHNILRRFERHHFLSLVRVTVCLVTVWCCLLPTTSTSTSCSTFCGCCWEDSPLCAWWGLVFPSNLCPLSFADVCSVAFDPPPGGGSTVPHGGSDSSPVALWDSGSAAHAVPALPALHLPQDRRGSDPYRHHHGYFHGQRVSDSHSSHLSAFRATGHVRRPQYGSHSACAQRCAWSDSERHSQKPGGDVEESLRSWGRHRFVLMVNYPVWSHYFSPLLLFFHVFIICRWYEMIFPVNKHVCCDAVNKYVRTQ